MDNNKIKVIFETITPLHTGDAWQESKEIRPSSLIGSLRFWFEVICYFGGICLESDFDKKKGRFEKDIKNDEIKKKLSKYGTDFWGQIEALKELGIPLPAIIFGTTGWKSLIEIKKINTQYNSNNYYPFPIGKVELEELKYKKDKEDKEITPRWYFKKGFCGKFEATFKVPEEIEETIFFPLLNFMDKYGYWGGSWNVGYGRLKVKEIEINDKLIERTDWQKNEFDFSKFGKNEISVNDIESVSSVSFKNLKSNNTDEITEIDENIDKMLKIILSKENKIIQIQIKKCNEINKEAIKELIDIKAKLRKNIKAESRKKYKQEAQKKYKQKAQNDNDVKMRHEIFGYSNPTEGSKILPYINRLDESTYECGLLSIAGILNLYQEPKNEQQ
jgi:CRISPR-associated protein Cmr1